MAIKLILFFLSLLAPGWLALKLFWPRQSGGILRTLALAYSLGWGIITVQLFIALFWFRWPLGNWLLWLFMIEDAILLISYYLVHKIKWLNFKNIRLTWLVDLKTWRWRDWCLLIFILLFIGVAFVNALTEPLIAWDSLVNWSLKGQALFKHGGVVFDANKPSYWKVFSANNYPWNFSLSLAWLSFITGRFNDLANNLVTFSFYLSSIILVFNFLRHQTERSTALLFTFFLASAELLVYHSYNICGDLLLATLALAAFILLLEAVQRPRTGVWLLAGIFGGLVTMTKNEGIFYVLAAIPFIWLTASGWPKKQLLSRLGLYAGGLILASGAWWLFKLTNHLGVTNTAGGLVWHPAVIKDFLQQWFAYDGFNIFWAVLLLVLIFNFGTMLKRRLLAAGWLYLAVVWLGFMFVYVCSNSYIFVVDGTIVLRNSLTFFPIALLLTALTFDSKLLRGEAETVEPAAEVQSLPVWLRAKISGTAVLAKHKKLLKFLVVGTSGAAIDFALLAILVEIFHWLPLVANLASFSIAVVSNFFLNKFWTWRDTSLAYRRQFIKFFITSVLGLGINTLLMWLLLTGGLYYLWAKVIVSLVVAVWNYSVNNWWTFGAGKQV